MLCKIDQHTDIFKKFCPIRGFFPRLFFIRSPHEKKLQIDPRYSTTILYIYTYKLLRKIGPGRPIERNTTLDTYNIYINILYIYIYTHLVIKLILHWLWFTSIAIQLESGEPIRAMELLSPNEFITLNACPGGANFSRTFNVERNFTDLSPNLKARVRSLKVASKPSK